VLSVRSTIPQLACDFCTNIRPWTISGGIGSIGLQPFSNEVPMPVRNGNLLRRSYDAIPKRLHEIDSFIDGQFVAILGVEKEWVWAY
jgi:hypothetical protein